MQSGSGSSPPAWHLLLGTVWCLGLRSSLREQTRPGTAALIKSQFVWFVKTCLETQDNPYSTVYTHTHIYIYCSDVLTLTCPLKTFLRVHKPRKRKTSAIQSGQRAQCVHGSYLCTVRYPPAPSCTSSLRLPTQAFLCSPTDPQLTHLTPPLLLSLT